MTHPSAIDLVWCESIADWPAGLRPGALLLAMDARGVSNDRIAEIAGWCLEAQPSVVVCWGPDCGRVHDLFDEVEVGDGASSPPPPPLGSVISTWHDDEPLDAAFEMLHLQIEHTKAARPHVAVVIGNRGWLAQADALTS